MGEPQASSKEENLTAALEEWREKCDRIHLESEKMVAKQKLVQAELEEKLAESEGNLDAARTKSNELEAKLKAAPSELFSRLFPDIQGCTEEKAALHISALQNSAPAGDEVEKLEGQVEHYKAVLAQTESMLTSLQASVESAESDWRVKLDATTKELTDARGQASSLAEKAAALEKEVAQSAHAGEGPPSMPYIESGPSSFILDSGPASLQFSESGAPSLGSQHGMKFAYSALEGA